MRATGAGVPVFKLTVIAGLTAVPLFLVLLPAGRVAFAFGCGVALGEGIRDLIEGYEVDDPGPPR